ncbi:MAG: hypothetical protein E7011_00630 [Alphaproteobacteria bacterium]|nr:hypothetical protein [Alphaproteobacteria bacterium]
MKKYVILTSVLALAACGGGSGGGGSAGTPSGGYVAPRPAVTPGVATSNAEITNMSSEIVVASNSNTPVSVVRSATVNNGGVTYTSYRLDDVKLFTAENLDTSGHSYINLELNNNTGEIDAVKMMVGGEASGRIARDTTDTTTFAGPIFEYTLDGEDKAQFRVVDNGQDMAALNALATQNNLSGGHWNRVDERMIFGTNGEDAGLQYSDFGHFNPIYRSKNKELSSDADILAARAGTLNRSADLDKYRTDEEFNALLAKEDYQLFAGGYAISGTNMLDSLPVPVPAEGNNTYKGKAVGRVYTSIQSNDVDRTAYLTAWNVPYDLDTDDDNIPDAWSENAGHDMAKAYTTSEATMTIGADGTQTLVMPFNTQSDTSDTFYDVTITKNSSNEINVNFDGTPSEAQYRMNNNPTPSSTEGEFTPGYYGVNTPVEAAGTARYYTEQELDTNVTREWEVQAAYGMQKQ